MFCQKNFCVDFDMIVDNSFAFIHFVKYSMATKAYLRLSCVVGRAPKMSMPHHYRGHVGGH